MISGAFIIADLSGVLRRHTPTNGRRPRSRADLSCLHAASFCVWLRRNRIMTVVLQYSGCPKWRKMYFPPAASPAVTGCRVVRAYAASASLSASRPAYLDGAQRSSAQSSVFRAGTMAPPPILPGATSQHRPRAEDQWIQGTPREATRPESEAPPPLAALLSQSLRHDTAL